MADVSLGRSAHFKSASVAAPEILAVSASPNRGKYRPFFVLNPATGALEVPADLRLKVHEALLAEARCIQLGLKRRRLGLHIRKFGLQLRGALVEAHRKASGYLLNFTGNRHGRPRL
jgi:hypothetical protein